MLRRLPRLAAAARVLKHPNRLVLDATNTKRVRLVVVAPVCVVAAVAHVPAVGVVAVILVLAGTPPVAAVADTVETAIRVAVAARQSRKAVLVCTIATAAPTACSLQIPACRRIVVRT